MHDHWECPAVPGGCAQAEYQPAEAAQAYEVGFWNYIILENKRIQVKIHTRSNGTQHYCTSDDCPKNRKLSFSNEPDNDAPAFVFTTTTSGGGAAAPNGTSSGGAPALSHNSDLLLNHLGDDQLAENGGTLLVAGVGGDKAELTCISEEGIADMDLPDNLFDEFDYMGDCITSCNKVGTCLEEFLYFIFICFYISRWKTT